jgi:HD-GYP domain-containing protein (c-di-GMP phosphodiesterase class II)
VSLLEALAFAGDLAFGLELTDGLRSCYVAMRLADELGLDEDDRRTVYYTALLKDAGCTCWTTGWADFFRTNEIEARRDLFVMGGASSFGNYVSWLRRYPGAQSPLPVRLRTILQVIAGSGKTHLEAVVNTAAVCSRISERLGLPPSVQGAIRSLWEQWDGKGAPARLSGTEIPIASRIVLPTFVIPPIARVAGHEAAREGVRMARGKAFDPHVVDAFLALGERPEFWEGVESETIAEDVLALEPSSTNTFVGEERLDDVARAFADFIDLKSPFNAAHSRRVARVAETLAQVMGCGKQDVDLFRRAALVHDLGLVAVPSHVLNRPERSLSLAEREMIRLHPYYGQRILSRVPMMAEIEAVAGAHHENMDGTGYFRGLKGREIPVGARIIAVANRLDELTHDAPGKPAVALADALEVLRAESGSQLDPDIVLALRSSLLGEHDPDPTPRQWPAGLTDREVEVLRLAARGLTRREVGERLAISEHTVRHHLEHIYNKTGTSTRVALTLFGMEHDLIQ